LFLKIWIFNLEAKRRDSMAFEDKSLRRNHDFLKKIQKLKVIRSNVVFSKIEKLKKIKMRVPH